MNTDKISDSFRAAVLSVVRRIAYGQTMTYKEVAVAVGRPRAFRAVGNVLGSNYDPEIPCHRVIRSDGKTGGWNRGEAEKRRLLEEERDEPGFPPEFTLDLIGGGNDRSHRLPVYHPWDSRKRD